MVLYVYLLIFVISDVKFSMSEISAPDDVLTCDQCWSAPGVTQSKGYTGDSRCSIETSLLGWKPKHSDNLIKTK